VRGIARDAAVGIDRPATGIAGCAARRAVRGITRGAARVVEGGVARGADRGAARSESGQRKRQCVGISCWEARDIVTSA